MMRRLWIIPVVFVALLVPAAVLAGGGGGFDGVVRSIEGRYQVHAMRIPFMGLISLVARKATHEGVANLHVATFEQFSAAVDGDELNRMVTEKLGNGWERIVRETSRHGTEQTLVFMRQEGARMVLFVVDCEGNELDVVEVSVDADHLNQEIGRYEHHHHGEGDGEDSD